MRPKKIAWLSLILFLAGTAWVAAAERPYLRAAAQAAGWIESTAVATPRGTVWPAVPPDPTTIQSDLYSGVGGIALFLAPEAESVLGIEEEGSAFRDACKNSSLNKIGNVRFLPGRVERQKDSLMDADVVIVDPPRSGCSPEALSALARSQARRLVYVSCNPTTLARDVKFLYGKGFRLARVVPIDLFPHSFHIEAVARLDR